jgi:glycine/D-amino acid oxidase-like deaminating enzyme
VNADTQEADIVICGAGIAGIAAAYFLTMRQGVRNVVLVDGRAPLTLTSDKSSEGYRNWWPGPGAAMVRLMDRSIDLLEELASESGNSFHMSRRGYVYLTADQERIPVLKQDAAEISLLGAGPLRVGQFYSRSPANGYMDQPHGADLVLDPALIHTNFPFISRDVVGMLHARRCGWLSAQQLGMVLLEKAREGGARLVNGHVTQVATKSNQVDSVTVETSERDILITTRTFINAAGPLAKEVAALLDVHLPLFNELHGKITFEDSLGIISRDAPLMIWNDPITLPWTDAERRDLAAYGDTAWMLEQLPPGLHFRPEGGPGSQTLLFLWPYHTKRVEQPVWPVQFEPEFVEIVLRGMVRMVPDMAVYLERMSPPYIDGGYYCKTQENRPLICPLPVSGAYVIGGLSGYGIMAAMAGAELLIAHVCDSALPDYAPYFDLSRYDDPNYKVLLRDWDTTAGQL